MSVLKRAVEAGLARGIGPWLARRERQSLAVLAYHNIVPEGESPGIDRSLHLSRASFEQQLDVLEETHQVIPLSEALESLASGNSWCGNNPRAVVTFDDAYRGAMTCGLEALARRDLPSTVFVSPGLLDGGPLWWEEVPVDREESTGRGEYPATDSGAPHDRGRAPGRETMLTEFDGRGEEILVAADVERWPRLEPPIHARPVRGDELAAAARRYDVTFGAHGWSHPNLTQLEPREMNEELERPLRWLREHLESAALPVLSYPYGRHSDEVERAARLAGYRAAFRVSGGLVEPSSTALFSLPRINVPAGVSVDGFRLRVLGLLG